MRSRTCYFNTAIFFKNVTRFWPVWVSYTLVCLWSLPVYTWTQIHAYAASGVLTEAERVESRLINVIDSLRMAILPMPVFLFAAISGIAVFSYLYQARSANMIHALPVRREELFLTNYISGLLFLLVPQVLAFLITVFVWFGNGVNQLEYLLQWLGLAAGEAVLAYSLAVFSAMLTGQIAAAAAYFFLLNYLYKGICVIINVIMRTIVYGMNMEEFSEWGAWLSPLPFLREHVRILYQKDNQVLNVPEIGGLEYVPGYAAAALGLTVLALVIYRRRDIESAADVISIGWMRPLFRWCGGAAAAGTCTCMVWESLFWERCGDMFWIVLLCCSVAGLAGFFLCEMMIRKKFRVFTGKRMAESGVFLAVMVLFLGCMEKDVFGIERRLPKEKEIAGIYLDGSYRSYLTEASQIRQCLAVHKSMIDAKKEYEAYFKAYSQKENCPYMTCNLTYELKNGTVMKRSYVLPLEDYYVEETGGAVEMLFALEKNPEKYLEYYFSGAYGSLALGNGCSYNHFKESGNYQNEELSVEEAEQLYAALKEDMCSEDYRIYPYGWKKRETEVYVDTIALTYTIPEGTRVFQMEDEKFSIGKYPEYVNIPLTADCRKTLALLREMGYLGEEEEPVTEREYEKIMEEYELQ